MSRLPIKKRSKTDRKGALKNPFFYFGFMAFALFGFLFFGSPSLAKLNALKESSTVVATPFSQTQGVNDADLFFNQHDALAKETPDLKIVQDNFIAGIATLNILTTQTLGSIFGEGTQERKDVIDYEVQAGDTAKSVAAQFNVSLETILWANELNKGEALKVGQNLIILPVSGVLHVAAAGDTLAAIAKKYKVKVEDIISFNNLQSEGDLFIGDILIIPGGVLPSNALPSSSQAPLADSFFIFPAEGYITQGLHFFNAVDLANKCGTPIYAAAAGTVQRAVGNNGWNFGMGNYITILHSNGVSTYYGHLMTLFVKPGDQINVGDRIGLMGRTGEATGCHVHFQVMGAKNPLSRYSVGSVLHYK